MKKKIILIVLLLIAILLLSITISKLNSTENYFVDISGGFEPPCNYQGDCVINK
jgi:hypothetical protein